MSERTAEDYALKSMHLAKMTGVSVGAHAIPDCFLMMHTGVGCKYKTAAQVSPHDWGSHPNKREAWTQVAELQLVQGCSERIGPFVRAWYERRRPAFMPVVSAYFIELTGEDFSHAVVEAEKTVPCDMALIHTVAPNRGFFDGYAALALEALKRGDWKSPPADPQKVAFLGHFFHRYEPDQEADVLMIRSLAAAAGVDAGPIALSGASYAEVTSAAQCGRIVELPYLRPHLKRFRKLYKDRPQLELDLPMGMAGTERFVRTLARTFGDARRAEVWLQRQRAAIEPQLNKFRDHVKGGAIAVVAETPLAAGIVTVLHELGMRAAFVGLRDPGDSLGGLAAFQKTLHKLGVPVPDDVVANPSLREIRRRWIEALRQERFEGFVGSSHELSLISSMPSGLARRAQSMSMEVGFPSDYVHPTLRQGMYGPAGLLGWAARFLQLSRAEAYLDHAPRL